MADDLIPTKDTSNNANRHFTSEAAQQIRQVGKFTRDELEDKYLRMYEEYIILKKHTRKQEDKIKRMATKLLRLVNDKKKLEKEGKGVRSIEVEEKFEEMSSKIRELEKQNNQLRERLMLTKQQLSSVGPNKRGTYGHVQARINTGLPPGKHAQTIQVDPRIAKNLRVMGPPPQHHTHHHQQHQQHQQHLHVQTSSEHLLQRSSPVPRYGHSILEATRSDKTKLEHEVAQMREQIHVYEMEIESLQEQNKLRAAEYEEDMLKVKQQMTSEQKSNLQENIGMIKLQRELKETSTMLTALQDKYQQLEGSSRAVKQSHDQILREMEHLNLQLQEEQNRNLSLQNELKMTGTNQRKLTELQEQVTDLQRECEVLKEANEKLVTSAFDLEREREWRQKENSLKVQIAQLEATMKSDLGEKGSIIDRYASERDAHEKLQAEHREMQVEYFTLKEQMDDLNAKMKFFTKESEVDFTEIEEALVLIKQKKQREQKPPDFLQAVDDELTKDHRRALVELQAEYAETVHELEKTRNMLVVQHKINKDYQTEVKMSTDKMDELKKEYEMKLDEYARLLDIRAARIKKLEAQLRDVAYGTRQYRLPPADEDDTESVGDFDETISLERGQNLFEIHVEKLSLSKEALEIIGDEEPSLFCTWEFFEFEIQSTPVVRGPRPMFDFTSQYIVKVDDFFLHYLQKDSCTLELHQSFGQEFKTVAACQMIFCDIFDKPHGRIHCTATLTGITDGETGIGYGTVEYWVRLRVPMEQALRLYKERTKALGYIMTNERMATQALEALDETAAQRPPNNVNELHVKVIRCSKLQPRRQNVQPSPYCAYKLLDFPDHDTIIIRNSNNPEFNDHKIYSVPVTHELDQYLRTAKFQVYIFDDTDPEIDAYLGVAEIPLLQLAHDKPISGEFQLTRGTGKVPSGVIEVELKWQYKYLPPKVPKHEPQELEMAPDEPPQKLQPEGRPTRDDLVKSVQATSATDQQRSPDSRRSQRGPKATSTPMEKERMQAVEAQVVHAGPKAVSRRKVHMADDQPTYAEAVKQGREVDDTVSQVVSGFMPNMSESLSSVHDPSVSQTPQDPSSIRGSAERRDSTGRGWSELGDLLEPRPRSEILVESGSEGEAARETTPKESPATSAREATRESEGSEVEEEIMEEVISARQSVTSDVSEPSEVQSDSDGVMMRKRRKHKKSYASDNMTIVISSVSLDEESAVMTNDNVKQLFVEYKFCDIDLADTETPFSLPKPKPGQTLHFNFSKQIAVDMDHHYTRRRFIAGLLLGNGLDKHCLKFTVVSEPPDSGVDESLQMECEEVGSAFVDVREMLTKGQDLKDANIPIYDAETGQTVIGQMMVTIECVEVLRAVESEIQVDGTF